MILKANLGPSEMPVWTVISIPLFLVIVASCSLAADLTLYGSSLQISP